MEVRYYKEYSHFLGKDMEFKVYGTNGVPCLYIPCQNGRFFDFENFGMQEHLWDFIEQGKMRVFSIDTVDEESVSSEWKPMWERGQRQEEYFRYVTDELVPRIHQICAEQGSDYEGIMTMGFSLGAYHAANFFFRRPDLFTSGIALSGIYRLGELLGDYMDENIYNNSPIDFLKNMPSDHPYIEKYNQNRMIICVGQGDWEHPMIESTGELADVLTSKGIDVWVDFWGHDVAHHWYWWKKQVSYFLPQLL